jgi:phage-related protein
VKTASEEGILVVHAFAKKAQQTPPADIKLRRKRLKEMLDDKGKRRLKKRLENRLIRRDLR